MIYRLSTYSTDLSYRFIWGFPPPPPPPQI